MDTISRQRLAAQVRKLRGKRSHREFAPMLGVAASTISGWESCKNLPNLENLEKLAELASQLPEVFLARLYGRDITTEEVQPVPIAFAIHAMDNTGVSEVLVAIAKKLGGGK